MKLSNLMSSLVENASIMRTQLLDKLFDDRRDIDSECGYPKTLSSAQYRYLYDREGVAARVVKFWPEETWCMPPEVYETEEPELTAWETEWEKLLRTRNVLYHLHKLDEISGIGRFGILLMGIDDGLQLHQEALPAKGRKLLYLRTFAEDSVVVDTRESDPTNERYGKPVLYSVTFEEQDTLGNVSSQRMDKVHWSRVIHVADGRETSLVYGTPRMQVVYNRLYDLRKIVGGSGEMFWKGAFPGYSVETHPDIPEVDLDTDALKSQLSAHFNGLQRYMALTGVSIKSLAPQVADPTKHVDMNMKLIAFSMGVPWRKFMGSEQAQLASSQDSETWNKRVSKRQNEYVTPMIVQPFVDRCGALGILPELSEGSYVTTVWPDLGTVTDMDKAEVAGKRTEAFARYVGGDVDQLIPPEEYLTVIHKMDPYEVAQIMKAAEEHQDLVDEDDLDTDPLEPALAPSDE